LTLVRETFFERLETGMAALLLAAGYGCVCAMAYERSVCV